MLGAMVSPYSHSRFFATTLPFRPPGRRGLQLHANASGQLAHGGAIHGQLVATVDADHSVDLCLVVGVDGANAGTDGGGRQIEVLADVTRIQSR
jgi:hypothetical protein